MSNIVLIERQRRQQLVTTVVLIEMKKIITPTQYSTNSEIKEGGTSKQ